MSVNELRLNEIESLLYMYYDKESFKFLFVYTKKTQHFLSTKTSHVNFPFYGGKNTFLKLLHKIHRFLLPFFFEV